MQFRGSRNRDLSLTILLIFMSRRVELPITTENAKRLSEHNAYYLNRDMIEYLLKVIDVDDPLFEGTDCHLLTDQYITKKDKTFKPYERIQPNDIWACEIIYTDQGGAGLKQKSIIVIDKNYKVREDWHETLSKPEFSR